MHTGYCSLDGNEKLCRPMCAAPKTKTVAGNTSETRPLKVIHCCPETPLMGGKNKKPSKLCKFHDTSTSTSTATHTIVNQHRQFQFYTEFTR